MTLRTPCGLAGTRSETLELAPKPPTAEQYVEPFVAMYSHV